MKLVAMAWAWLCQSRWAICLLVWSLAGLLVKAKPDVKLPRALNGFLFWFGGESLWLAVSDLHARLREYRRHHGAEVL